MGRIQYLQRNTDIQSTREAFLFRARANGPNQLLSDGAVVIQALTVETRTVQQNTHSAR